MTPLEAAYASLSERTSIGWEEFLAFARDWDVVPVWLGGRLAGAVLIKGPEIHACILPWAHRRWLGRWALVLVNRLIDEHGYVQTHAATEAGKQFVARMGFLPHGDGYRRYRKWDLKR